MGVRLVNPHGGGSLRPLLLEGEQLVAERSRARLLPKLTVSSRERGDLIMLGIGGFTPLEGFMTRADWEGVCDGNRTASGLFWPIPITLSTDAGVADGIKTGAEIALVDPDSDEILATMRVSERPSQAMCTRAVADSMSRSSLRNASRWRTKTPPGASSGVASLAAATASLMPSRNSCM